MEEFLRLVELIETLRGEKGCPWDKKQTVVEFKTFLLEEVYELIEAIDREDYAALKEELGDLLFHIIFISQICKEEGHFNIKEVIQAVYKKMYNRHPHVFSTEQPHNVEQRWEEIKRDEKEGYSTFANIPSAIPALLRAYMITKRAARIGFDWERVEDIYTKLDEELLELKEAEKSGDKGAIKEEIGDLLFTIVNISRFHNIDPEDALRFTAEKFIRRFSYIEQNIEIGHSTMDRMDYLWDEIKRMEKEGE
jgi:MazG family protein